MSLIIDANVAHRFPAKTPEATLVMDWVEAKPGRLMSGGRNITELSVLDWMRRWLANLIRAGRLTRIDSDILDKEEKRLVALGACKSDDPHVIALALKSGARILFSEDHALHEDFCNKSLIDNPRGRVYQTTGHRHLLRDDPQ